MPEPIAPTARPDVAVVGGGLAGLTAATYAARAGASVVLYEARGELGGRARTEDVAGARANQGPHALYKAAAGMAILRDLGVTPKGRMPKQLGGQWVHDGQVSSFAHLGPIGGARGLRTALRMTRSATAREARGRSMADWLAEEVDAEARPFAEMLVRTTGYSVDFAHQDAEEALDQVRRGARGVLYLDGGWSTLVDGLRAAALGAGVTIRHERVTGVEAGDGGATLVLGDDSMEAGAVVLAAGGAAHADKLLDGASARVAGWAAAARPVRGLALDLVLRDQPKPKLTAYGLGRPIYLVNHAATARLAPAGTALVQCLWYEPDLVPDIDHRAELEAAMDLLRPGWRDHLVEARLSRSLVVAHDRPQPGVSAADRPVAVVDDLPGVFVAGDWITGEGILADAALSSGRAAGRAAGRTARRAVPLARA